MTAYSYVSRQDVPVGKAPLTDRTKSTVRPGARQGVVNEVVRRVSSLPPQADQRTLNNEARFIDRVSSHLKALGAIAPTSEYWWRPWVLETRAGKLYVLVYGSKILCRFEDQARAADILSKTNSNRLAGDDGSWNFIFPEGGGQVDVFKIEVAMLRRTTMSGVADEAYIDHTSIPIPVIVPPSIR